MSDETPQTAATARIINSRAEFQAALREALAEAATAGSRELWLSDLDYADWPLGEREVVASFERWAASSRRITLSRTTSTRLRACTRVGSPGAVSGRTS